MIDKLPDSSKVWFFGANRILSKEEVESLSKELTNFTNAWTAHGAQLTAGFLVLHNSIVIVAVDESKTPPSGCSIDKVFALLRLPEVDFFHRTLLWQPFCESVKIFTVDELKSEYRAGLINENVLMVNSQVFTLEDVRRNLYIDLKSTWAWNRIMKNEG